MPFQLEPGVLVAGRYQLERALGQGGMGVVWSAVHTVTRKRVALKFLRGPVHLRPELRRRFLREARAASAVVHPNVLEVHDVFELDDQTPVMLMDLLEGETLGARLTKMGRLSLAETADILIQVISAVGTAHAVGVVHRDLKPDNVFLVRTASGPPSVRVLDFGIAKLVGLEGPTAETGVITGTGSMLGTPCYMSPEQSFGEKVVDYRTDIWSLGVILYECLSGARPVEGDSIGQIVKRLVSDGITPISVALPSLPSDVATLIDAMLARERENRPQDLREVSAVLSRHTSVQAPTFGAAVSDRVEEESVSEPVNRIVVDSGDTDPSAETHAAPRGPETAGAHTVSQVGASRRPSRAVWLIAAIVGIGAGAAFLMRPSSSGSNTSASASRAEPAPAQLAASSDRQAASAGVAVNAATPVAPSGAAGATAEPPQAIPAEPKPSDRRSLGHPKAEPSVRVPVTAPAASSSAKPPSPPAPRPPIGGLAEKPPF